MALLEKLALLVRKQLGLDAAQMPLVCGFKSGIRVMGQVLAQQLHQGLPPLNTKRGGTVF